MQGRVAQLESKVEIHSALISQLQSSSLFTSPQPSSFFSNLYPDKQDRAYFYYKENEKDKMERGEVVGIIGSKVVKTNHPKVKIFGVIPLNPYDVRGQPKERREREKGVDVAYLGHVMVKVEERERKMIKSGSPLIAKLDGSGHAEVLKENERVEMNRIIGEVMEVKESCRDGMMWVEIRVAVSPYLSYLSLQFFSLGKKIMTIFLFFFLIFFALFFNCLSSHFQYSSLPCYTKKHYQGRPFSGETTIPLFNNSYSSTFNRFITIHHTACCTNEGIQSALTVQNIHQLTRGWSDTGFHFIVSRQGHIITGRDFHLSPSSSLSSPSFYPPPPTLALGAHLTLEVYNKTIIPFNNNNIGVALVGCYNPHDRSGWEGIACEDEITNEMRSSLIHLLVWLTSRYK